MGRAGKRFIQIILVLVVLLVVVNICLYEPDIPLTQLKGKYANAASKFIKIDGMDVHYRVEGAGYPLVLIHGTGSMLQTWDGWEAALSKDFTIYRMDIPAFGLTGPRADDDYSDSMYVHFIDAFAQSQHLDSFYLGGNSLGGLIAWKYAAAYPAKVKKLILVDPAGFHSKNHGPSFVFKLAREHPQIAALFGKIGTKYLVRHTIHDIYGDEKKISQEEISMYTDLNRREGNRNAFVQRAKYVHQCEENELTPIISPTLVLWGKKDKLIYVGEAEHFKKIAKSVFIFYPDAGHVPQEEIPRRSASDVKAFLKGE